MQTDSQPISIWLLYSYSQSDTAPNIGWVAQSGGDGKVWEMWLWVAPLWLLLLLYIHRMERNKIGNVAGPSCRVLATWLTGYNTLLGTVCYAGCGWWWWCVGVSWDITLSPPCVCSWALSQGIINTKFSYPVNFYVFYRFGTLSEDSVTLPMMPCVEDGYWGYIQTHSLTWYEFERKRISGLDGGRWSKWTARPQWKPRNFTFPAAVQNEQLCGCQRE